MLTKCKDGDRVNNMKSDKEIFVTWLKHAIKIEDRMKGGELAKAVGVDPATISGYLTGKSKGPRTVAERIAICKALDADYEQIITDYRNQGPPSAENPTIDHILTLIEQVKKDGLYPKPDIIPEFEFKMLALKINRALLKYEKLKGRAGLEEIERYLKYQLFLAEEEQED